MAGVLQMMRDVLARVSVEQTDYKVEPIKTTVTLSFNVAVGNKTEIPYAVYGINAGSSYSVWAELKEHIRGAFVSAVIKNDGLLYLTVCNFSGEVLPALTEVDLVIAQALPTTN